MAGSDSIDIVSFHRNNIEPELLGIWDSSDFSGEFMTVNALKDDTLSVKIHNPIFYLKLSESEESFGASYPYLVKIGLFRAPKKRILYRNFEFILSLWKLYFLGVDNLSKRIRFPVRRKALRRHSFIASSDLYDLKLSVYITAG